MKKPILIVSLFVLLFFTFFHISRAASVEMGWFGGQIIDEEASHITEAESAGYECNVPGDTFDIRPVGSSIEGPFLVPAGVTARGGGVAVPGRWTLGLYNLAPTSIVCPNEDPYLGTIVVEVYSITIFGVSKG